MDCVFQNVETHTKIHKYSDETFFVGMIAFY